MNRCLLCWVIILSAIVAPVRADVPAQDPGIPANYKSDDAALANKDAISGLISAEVDKLSKDEDTGGQGMARDWLIAEGRSASAGYRDVYTSALNQAFVTLLSNPKSSVRARVNAAIITTKVIGSSSKNTELLPTTLLMLGKDQSDAVVYWAEQAAGNMVPTLLAGNNVQDRQSLFSAMVQAAIDHSSPPIGGYIIETTYTYLNPVMKGLNPAAPGFSDLADANVKLQRGRLDLYKKGIPENPYADTYPSQFVLDPNYWGKLNPQQQQQGVQGISDLIRAASGYAVGGNVPITRMAELMHTVASEGQCGKDWASKALANQTLANAFQAVSVLGVASQAADIKVACDNAISALHDAFPNLQAAGAAQ